MYEFSFISVFFIFLIFQFFDTVETPVVNNIRTKVNYNLYQMIYINPISRGGIPPIVMNIWITQITQTSLLFLNIYYTTFKPILSFQTFWGEPVAPLPPPEIRCFSREFDASLIANTFTVYNREV